MQSVSQAIRQDVTFPTTWRFIEAHSKGGRRLERCSWKGIEWRTARHMDRLDQLRIDEIRGSFPIDVWKPTTLRHPELGDLVLWGESETDWNSLVQALVGLLADQHRRWSRAEAEAQLDEAQTVGDGNVGLRIVTADSTSTFEVFERPPSDFLDWLAVRIDEVSCAKGEPLLVRVVDPSHGGWRRVRAGQNERLLFPLTVHVVAAMAKRVGISGRLETRQEQARLDARLNQAVPVRWRT